MSKFQHCLQYYVSIPSIILYTVMLKPTYFMILVCVKVVWSVMCKVHCSHM